MHNKLGAVFILCGLSEQRDDNWSKQSAQRVLSFYVVLTCFTSVY